MEKLPRYFEVLGIRPDWESDREKLRAALNRAYEQRSFEIEHFWKRGTFFWAFQAAAFAAFGLIWKEVSSGCPGQIVLVAISIIGFLTALANSFAARGSKFWQENWEKHIDMLEDRLEGSLYRTVWLQKNGVSYSVSAISGALSDCFAAFWIFAVVYTSWRFLGTSIFGWNPGDFSVRAVVIALSVLALLGGVKLLWKGTRLEGMRYVPGSPPRRWRSWCSWRSSELESSDCAFLLRDPPSQ